jgi:DNA-binding NarL/FixJ family response regulator
MQMPIMDGVESTLKALQILPDLKIIIVTMPGEMDYYREILYAGAMGILLKTSGKKEFEKAIKTVLSGENYFSLELLNQILVN